MLPTAASSRANPPSVRPKNAPVVAAVAAAYDVVVGNPPFLNQLRRATALSGESARAVKALIGTGAAHIFAEIDQVDTNFILRLWDTAPTGKRQLITTGYLKASHRELDLERSTEGSPVHPHTREVPVESGTVEEYVVRLYPFANTFRAGHRIVVLARVERPERVDVVIDHQDEVAFAGPKGVHGKPRRK